MMIAPKNEILALFQSIYSLKDYALFQSVYLRKDCSISIGFYCSIEGDIVLEMKERKLVCRANRLFLVKCYDIKKVKSLNNWVISPLTQLEVANQ